MNSLPHYDHGEVVIDTPTQPAERLLTVSVFLQVVAALCGSYLLGTLFVF
jgi:hypothetical protein